jgi:hypothetical protein
VRRVRRARRRTACAFVPDAGGDESEARPITGSTHCAYGESERSGLPAFPPRWPTRSTTRPANASATCRSFQRGSSPTDRL